MTYMDMMGGMAGWMWLMMAGAAVFWIAVLFIAIWAIRRVTAKPTRSSARSILEERYARGEIDADEFRRRLEFLEA